MIKKPNWEKRPDTLPNPIVIKKEHKDEDYEYYTISFQLAVLREHQVSTFAFKITDMAKELEIQITKEQNESNS